MSQDSPKRMRMFAGPNGSGKTSLIRRLALDYATDGLFQLHHFINADDLFRDLQEEKGIPLDFLGRVVTVEQVRAAILAGGRLASDHPFLPAAQIRNARLTAPASVCDGYVAAAIADFFHAELLAAGKSFSFETVMSHPSKIAILARARAASYRTYLYYIATESPHINILRVKNRTILGGHDVPEEKIVERYWRSLQQVRQGLVHAYRAFLFDNSGGDPVWLAELTPERKMLLKVAEDSLPMWFRTSVLPA
jgi:predicted ABC-type ATPase